MALLAFGEIGELERGGVDEFDGVGLERPAKLDHVGNARNHAASFDVADPRMPGAYHQPKPCLLYTSLVGNTNTSTALYASAKTC